MSTGLNFNALSHDFLIGRSTIAEIIRETCIHLWCVLQPKEMPEPTEEKWLSIAELFYTKTNFPNCLGAVDGKHVRLNNPAHSGSNFLTIRNIFQLY